MNPEHHLVGPDTGVARLGPFGTHLGMRRCAVVVMALYFLLLVMFLMPVPTMRLHIIVVLVMMVMRTVSVTVRLFLGTFCACVPGQIDRAGDQLAGRLLIPREKAVGVGQDGAGRSHRLTLRLGFRRSFKALEVGGGTPKRGLYDTVLHDDFQRAPAMLMGP